MSEATPKRYTALNAKEHDQDEPKTKRVSLYGWDGSQKTRITVTEDGKQQIDLPSNASTATNQTDGTQKTQIVDASKSVIGSDIHGSSNHLLTDTLDVSTSGTLDGLDETVELDVHGVGSVVILVSGTWKGKIVFEGTIDSTWINLSLVQPLGTITQNGIQNDNQNGSYRALITAGYSKIRLRMSSYTSGSATVSMNASDLVATNYVWQLNASNLQTTATLSATDNAVLDDIVLNQTDASQKTQIVDGSGNSIDSTQHITGNFHLDSAVIQDVVADNNNSSTTNLDAPNYTFTGTKTSTLGVVGIQVSLFADKNCIVKVQQSPDATPHWDLTDTYYYTANSNFGVTVQAISSYVRVVVTTNNETTTTFRLQTALCPIVEAVPRSLDGNGNFKVATGTDPYGFQAENTPMGEIRTSEPTRLVGANFEGTTIDPNFWTTAASGTSATIAQANSQLLITSGTSSGATVTAYTTRRARYIGGIGMRYRAVMQLEAGTANNKRRWGIGFGASMPTVTDGAWFQLDGTEFSIVTCKGTNETKVTSFNGQLGATFDIGTNVRTYEIYWTNSKIYFVIGDDILHTVSASSATWANTMAFHVFMDSYNSDTASSKTMSCRVATISRLGKLLTQPTSKYQSGTTAGVVCKYGAGNLHGITVSGVSNTSTITLYDNTSAGGTVLWTSGSMGATTQPFDIHFHALPFYIGLTLVIANANSTVTLIYE